MQKSKSVRDVPGLKCQPCARPHIILYDNMRSVVLARHENQVRFHPRLLELAAHYHFAAPPCRPARGNEKGRGERVIRYIRESFFAARPFTTLEDFNRQAHLWRIRWPIHAPGRRMTPALWPKPGLRNSRACCLCPHIRWKPIAWSPFIPEKPSICVSI